MNNIGLSETENNFEIVKLILEEAAVVSATTSDIFSADVHKQTTDIDACGVGEDCKTRSLSADELALSKDRYVPYTSIKEAFMREEGYFINESYIEVTPEAKFEKLVEQMALLISKESNDVLFEELIKSASNVRTFQESIINKYRPLAESKARDVIKLKEGEDNLFF
jgi:hypothetical protein